MTTPGTRHDADLDDLLEEASPSSSGETQEHLEMAPLNLDHLTMGQLDVTPPSAKKHSNGESSLINPLLYIQGVCLYCAYAHPRLCSCLVVTMIVSCLFLVSFSIMNPTLYLGEIHEDFSNIQSSFDLKLGQIDHWCLAGGDNSCRCEDPLVPTERGEFPTWTDAHHANKLLLKNSGAAAVDVAFLGESLVEEMNGRWMGRTKGDQLETMRTMFQNKFSRDSSGVEGVALGIAGDTSPNVLWRLLHGEMSDTFSPKIWWVSLGMNDLGRMQCSEEVVVMGILRVVEEILTQKPSAQVVINSMLPMADLRGGMYPTLTDYQDAFAGKTDTSHYARKPVNAKRPVVTTGNGERALGKEEKDDTPDKEVNVEKNLKKFQKDPRNPMLDANRHKIHKYTVFHRNKLPLWTSIHAINEELRKFASKHDRVTFFDATDIFASRVELNRYVLQSDMISIRGHPTVKGFEAWEDAILTRVKKMLDKMSDEEEIETPSEEEEEEESEEEEEETKEHESSEEDAIAKTDQAKRTEDDGHDRSSHPEAKRSVKDSESGEESESGDSKE